MPAQLADHPQSRLATGRKQRAGRLGRATRGLVACCMLLASGTAHAHNVDGLWGLGFEETLTGVGQRLDSQVGVLQRAAGLALRYWLGHWGLEAVVGANYHFAEDVEVTRSGGQTTVERPSEFGAFASVGGFYNVFRSPQVNMALGARLLGGLGRTSVGCSEPTSCSDDLGQASPVRYGLVVEFPLRAEFFLSPAFSIAGAVGVVYELGATGTHPLTGRADGQRLDLARGDFSGGLGFTWYGN